MVTIRSLLPLPIIDYNLIGTSFEMNMIHFQIGQLWYSESGAQGKVNDSIVSNRGKSTFWFRQYG